MEYFRINYIKYLYEIYGVNYKFLLKIIKEELNGERWIMFLENRF